MGPSPPRYRLRVRFFLSDLPNAIRSVRKRVPVGFAPPWRGPGRAGRVGSSYLLGLLAKIKCSICSYQLNLWYVTHGVTRV